MRMICSQSPRVTLTAVNSTANGANVNGSGDNGAAATVKVTVVACDYDAPSL